MVTESVTDVVITDVVNAITDMVISDTVIADMLRRRSGLARPGDGIRDITDMVIWSSLMRSSLILRSPICSAGAVAWPGPARPGRTSGGNRSTGVSVERSYIHSLTIFTH